ncbi:hypothetical protein ACTFIW_010082 [Dictyostelium discoideum]
MIKNNHLGLLKDKIKRKSNLVFSFTKLNYYNEETRINNYKYSIFNQFKQDIDNNKDLFLNLLKNYSNEFQLITTTTTINNSIEYLEKISIEYNNISLYKILIENYKLEPKLSSLKLSIDIGSYEISKIIFNYLKNNNNNNKSTKINEIYDEIWKDIIFKKRNNDHFNKLIEKVNFLLNDLKILKPSKSKSEELIGLGLFELKLFETNLKTLFGITNLIYSLYDCFKKFIQYNIDITISKSYISINAKNSLISTLTKIDNEFEEIPKIQKELNEMKFNDLDQLNTLIINIENKNDIEIVKRLFILVNKFLDSTIILQNLIFFNIKFNNQYPLSIDQESKFFKKSEFGDYIIPSELKPINININSFNNNNNSLYYCGNHEKLKIHSFIDSRIKELNWIIENNNNYNNNNINNSSFLIFNNLLKISKEVNNLILYSIYKLDLELLKLIYKIKYFKPMFTLKSFDVSPFSYEISIEIFDFLVSIIELDGDDNILSEIIFNPILAFHFKLNHKQLYQDSLNHINNSIISIIKPNEIPINLGKLEYYKIVKKSKLTIENYKFIFDNWSDLSNKSRVAIFKYFLDSIVQKDLKFTKLHKGISNKNFEEFIKLYYSETEHLKISTTFSFYKKTNLHSPDIIIKSINKQRLSFMWENKYLEIEPKRCLVDNSDLILMEYYNGKKLNSNLFNNYDNDKNQIINIFKNKKFFNCKYLAFEISKRGDLLLLDVTLSFLLFRYNNSGDTSGISGDVIDLLTNILNYSTSQCGHFLKIFNYLKNLNITMVNVLLLNNMNLLKSILINSLDSGQINVVDFIFTEYSIDSSHHPIFKEVNLYFLNQNQNLQSNNNFFSLIYLNSKFKTNNAISLKVIFKNLFK